MRNCPRCLNTAVIEDGYCGHCRECTLAPATGSAPLSIRPGFSFFIGKNLATIADEDECTFTYRIGDRFRWFNKPLFFERLAKRDDGAYYLAEPSGKPNG